jgi:hypothetical protein
MAKTQRQTKEDAFEQVVDFTLSEQYVISKSLVDLLEENARTFLNIL